MQFGPWMPGFVVFRDILGFLIILFAQALTKVCIYAERAFFSVWGCFGVFCCCGFCVFSMVRSAWLQVVL
jgi:hypothetical protein